MKYKAQTEDTITVEIPASEFYNIMQGLKIANDAILEQLRTDAQTHEDALFYANCMQVYNDIIGRMITASKDAHKMKK